MKRKRPGKALATAARSIKDSDEFLEHVANITELYRREHALTATARSSAVRQSLKQLRKHAAGLHEWFERAHAGNATTAASAALDQIGALLYAAPNHAHAVSKGISEWLAQAEDAARRCIENAKPLPRTGQQHAPKIAGAALRATFEHHKVKFAVQAAERSDAVRLLRAIAKDAGDSTLTPADAQLALRESGRTRSKKAAG